MTRRDLAYLCLTIFVAFLIVGAGNWAYTNYVDQQRTRAERAAVAARADETERFRLLICDLARRNAAVYEDAVSPIGQEARDVWLQLAAQFHCE